MYEVFIYNPKIKKKLKLLKLNSIIDVGANKGGFIDIILNINSSSSIHAFEPNPKIYQKLIFKYENKNIKINNLAVSDTTEKKIFYENIFDLTSSLEKPNLESEHSRKKIKTFGIKSEELIKNIYEVNTTTLSAYLKSQYILNIDFIKIDIEGHEFECLKGLFNNLECNIKYIQVEEHITESHSKSVRESKKILANNSFIEFNRTKHHLGNFYDVIYVNSK